MDEYNPFDLAREKRRAEPCKSHVSHPCEGCGTQAGDDVTAAEILAAARTHPVIARTVAAIEHGASPLRVWPLAACYLAEATRSLIDQCVQLSKLQPVQIVMPEADLARAMGRPIIGQVAAHDLLDVLKAAVCRVELANSEGNPILSAWLPDAKAAIAKVEGGAT